ncbi:chemotaxis response regulator protein-glutamate methylesterase [Neobacillus sp. PS3-12]|uniref:protein-glutamate methylesterase/protein-glutamine glutaminase n=1 Tax=Neobacillus sp. PS3-12 TaxID=3070677 RepID=UPI0027DF8FBE|nr:chemotaxis response regulator protein-glutamate methylesterase [Neobacillus sp. PS3-12]WML52017.1 chemotaxis response regulator protein-glutamate methylesterase [Neobacillus sp. PS3-12]
MEKIRVLVADDSAFMRKLIQEILLTSGRIEIAGTARNGKDAIEKTKRLKPDVVTMDIEMPVINGIDALKKIMKESPVPIVMLSSTTTEGAENTFLAIQNGAVDFIAKPSGTISLDLEKISDEIIAKVLAASKANLSSLTRIQQGKNLFPTNNQKSSKIELYIPSIKHQDTLWEKSAKKIVCIGTSTGGPRALQAVLSKLPALMPAPILIVQHMPAGFTKSLASRLNSLSKLTVKEAEDGEVLVNGTAYIAPGGYHLKVKRMGDHLAVNLDQSGMRNGLRPSVDLMFESVSQIPEYAKIAVIMTGMGTDGMEGLNFLHQSGKLKAIAESEETSIVFGMPKAAISTHLIDEVQNVETIAETILKYV